MSGGRLVFGAGLGYRDVEFKAFGTTAQERVQRLEENLLAIRRPAIVSRRRLRRASRRSALANSAATSDGVF